MGAMRTEKRILLIRALASSLLLILVSAPLPAATVEEEVRAAEARRFAAMVQVDAAALAGLLADDLTYTHSNGVVENKAQFLESLSSGRLRYLSIEPSEVVVRVYGDTAILTGRSTMKVKTGEQETTLPIRFTDVWVRQAGRWRMAAWQSTRIP